MKKILVVDDSAFTRSIHRRIILSLGDYEIIEAANGTQALSIFESTKPDLVILDLLMPDMDGIDLARKMVEACPEIPIVICSTDRQKYRQEEASEIGAVAFLTKPISPQKLGDIVNDQFSKDQWRDQNE